VERLRKDFSTITIVLMVVALAINIVIGTIIFQLKLPLYLDSIGTVLVGLLAGPWAGLLTGILSNLLWGLLGNPGYVPYAPVAGLIGLMAGVFGSLGWFKKWYLWIIGGGLITGILAALASAPITAYLYGGVLGSGTDFVVAFFRATGASVLEASLGQGIVSDPLDKLASFLIVYLIVLALPNRFLSRFPRAENVLEEEEEIPA